MRQVLTEGDERLSGRLPAGYCGAWFFKYAHCFIASLWFHSTLDVSIDGFPNTFPLLQHIRCEYDDLHAIFTIDLCVAGNRH